MDATKAETLVAYSAGYSAEQTAVMLVVETAAYLVEQKAAHSVEMKAGLSVALTVEWLAVL